MPGYYCRTYQITFIECRRCRNISHSFLIARSNNFLSIEFSVLLPSLNSRLESDLKSIFIDNHRQQSGRCFCCSVWWADWRLAVIVGSIDGWWQFFASLSRCQAILCWNRASDRIMKFLCIWNFPFSTLSKILNFSSSTHCIVNNVVVVVSSALLCYIEWKIHTYRAWTKNSSSRPSVHFCTVHFAPLSSSLVVMEESETFHCNKFDSVSTFLALSTTERTTIITQKLRRDAVDGDTTWKAGAN